MDAGLVETEQGPAGREEDKYAQVLQIPQLSVWGATIVDDLADQKVQRLVAAKRRRQSCGCHDHDAEEDDRI